MIVLAGGEVLTEAGWARTDVLVTGETIGAVGPDLSGDRTIDIEGCLLGPSFVDMHTHLREPGQTWKEDIASGSLAAVAGGYSAVVAMPNTDPPMDRPKVIDAVVRRGREVGLVDVIPSAALTVGRSGTAMSDLSSLYDIGVRLFTDDGDSVADPILLEEIMRAVAALPGAFVAQHAEDAGLTEGGHMHEGVVSRRLGIGGLPSAAETSIVARDLALAQRTGVHYHCQHVSSKMTVDLIRHAKESGLAVTAEVTPHHLSFDDSYLEGLDPDFKMYPPLRTDDDRKALVTALGDGTIDAVATDHAPHSPAEKAVPFEDAPRGVIGLETAAAAVWTELPDRDILFSAMSRKPALMLALQHHGKSIAVGGRANLTVFDPNTQWVPKDFVSKSSNSPYLGRPLKGRVRMTMYQGKIVYEIGEDTK